MNDGAVFYVCGDASRMAKDVDQALADDRPRVKERVSEEDAGVLGERSCRRKDATSRTFIDLF